ncbi:MAG: DinB family protein [Chloroflexi bacterium]|nr:DinB family protein [Chloroflexota bacterium]
MADESAIRELKEKMAHERAKLLSLFESFSDKDASTPPKPGEWNSKEQMAHLCEMESAYRAWVERALVEDNPGLDGVGGEPVAIPLERASRHTVAELIAEMRRQREKTLALMETLSPAAYDRTATSSLFGTLNVLQWLRSYYRHDRMHHGQARGEEPAYKPRFLSGREPDQRRPAAR